MKTYDNTLNASSKENLGKLVGSVMESWSATFPVDDNDAARSWGFARLDSSIGPFFLCLFEADDFPDIAKTEVLDESGFQAKAEKEQTPFVPDEWHPVAVGKRISAIRIFTDAGTEVRGTNEDATGINDACGIAFVFDDGSALLFEKTSSESEVWDVTAQQANSIRLLRTHRDKIVEETL